MSCNNTKNKLTPHIDALEYILSQAIAQKNKISTKIVDGYNKVLAGNVFANINVPEFDNSAVDGYAVNAQINKKPPYKFIVVDRITAGVVGNDLEKNNAARIFTGAAIPNNANAVIMQEDCEVIKKGDKEIIEVYKKIEANENIRPKANDIAKDDLILSAGKVLSPADIALIASIGVNEIKTFAPLCIGIFTSGNEIVYPDKKLSPGQIYNSNEFSIIGILKNLGVKIINLGIIKDDLEATTKALRELSKNCDMIITTGGVSVGEEDYLRQSVSSLGQINLWNIKMKPGKPLSYGVINLYDKKTHFIGLPGNPVSAIATFNLFIKPFIKKSLGITDHLNPSFKVQINYNWSAQFRTEFVRVKLDFTTLPPTASKYHKQGSDVLTSIAWADGFAEMTDEKSFKIGDIVNFYPMWS